MHQIKKLGKICQKLKNWDKKYNLAHFFFSFFVEIYLLSFKYFQLLMIKEKDFKKIRRTLKSRIYYPFLGVFMVQFDLIF